MRAWWLFGWRLGWIRGLQYGDESACWGGSEGCAVGVTMVVVVMMMM